MIRLGFHRVSLYPNTGIIFENHGGQLVFEGVANIGNASAISIGSEGLLVLGNHFSATANLKIACYNQITFEEHALIAWETTIIDTSFHKLKGVDGNQKGKTLGSIHIGKNNWIPTRCLVLKGTKTPDNCIVGAGSVLNKDYSHYPTHILMAGNPLSIKVKGIWRDPWDDGMY